MPNAFHALIFMCWMVPAGPQNPPYKSCLISHDAVTFTDEASCQKSLEEGFADLKKAPSFKQVEAGELDFAGCVTSGQQTWTLKLSSRGSSTFTKHLLTKDSDHGVDTPIVGLDSVSRQQPLGL